MKKTISTFAALGAVAGASPAFAHGSEHSHGFVTNLIHWLSSPVHGFFTVVALLALGSVATYFVRKKA